MRLLRVRAGFDLCVPRRLLSAISAVGLFHGLRLDDLDDTLLMLNDDTNDWRVKATLVPEPGTAVLLSLGLTALAIRRR